MTVVTVQNAVRLVYLDFIYIYNIYIIYIDKQKWIKYFIVTTVTTTAEGIGDADIPANAIRKRQIIHCELYPRWL